MDITQGADAIDGGQPGTYELDVRATRSEGHFEISIDSANATRCVVETAPAAGTVVRL